VFVPRYTEAEARAAVAASRSYAEALRRLGRCQTGNSSRVLKRWIAEWGIDTSHFDPDAARIAALAKPAAPLETLLVEASPVRGSRLKERLYAAGLKQPACELCGQDEMWQGRRMALVLDHVNGVRDDNRLENLRIVCPNCNATLDTHCGRNARLPPVERACLGCGATFRVRSPTHRYCSRECGQRHAPRPAVVPALRRVERPPLDVLLAQVEADGWEATGRAYGVSGNAVRKWVDAYRRAA
jgi:hypothetical protein